MRTRINKPSVLPTWATDELEARGLAPDPMWLFVDIKGPDDCWNFTGANKSDGYGRTRYNNKFVMAHRLSYCLDKGVSLVDFEKTKLLVRHKCDNPPCCNPKHLIAGTHADNAADKVERGRQSTLNGSSIGTAKLTEVQVLEIRKRLNKGEARKAVAESYSISLSTVKDIRSRRYWSHLEET